MCVIKPQVFIQLMCLLLPELLVGKDVARKQSKMKKRATNTQDQICVLNRNFQAIIFCLPWRSYIQLTPALLSK